VPICCHRRPFGRTAAESTDSCTFVFMDHQFVALVFLSPSLLGLESYPSSALNRWVARASFGRVQALIPCEIRDPKTAQPDMRIEWNQA
jgi:hypothetical protein